MRITEGNSEMIWHSRGMDKDWSLCHSHSEARPRMHGVNSCEDNPESCCHVEPQGDILYSILRHTGYLRHTGEGRCPVCIGYFPARVPALTGLRYSEGSSLPLTYCNSQQQT